MTIELNLFSEDALTDSMQLHTRTNQMFSCFYLMIRTAKCHSSESLNPPLLHLAWDLSTCRMPVNCLVRIPFPLKTLCGHIHQPQDSQLRYHLAMNHYYSFPTILCMLTPRVWRITHLQSPKAILALRPWWPLLSTQLTQTTRTSMQYWVSIIL